jgi:galactitol-specific phosphotransferase system IIB component
MNTELNTTTKNKYKLIILVIASHGDRYDRFLKIWEKYEACHPQIKVLYVYGNKIDITLEAERVERSESKADKIDRFIISDSVENFVPGILQKTIYSFEYIINNFEFDFVLRTNLSSFFVFPKLFAYLSELPLTRCYSGMKLQGRGHIPFISGAGIFLSCDMILLLTSKPELLDYSLVDDVSIGKFMKQHGIAATQISIPRYDGFSKENDLEKCKIVAQKLCRNSNYFHYRFKGYKSLKMLDPVKMEIVYQAFSNQ